MKHQIIAAGIFSLFFIVTDVDAHPGGLDSKGCHHDRKNGGYHCHGGPSANTTPAPTPSPVTESSATVSFNQIQRIQTVLIDFGYYSGPIDGEMNLEMNMGIMKFKKDRRLRFNAFDVNETALALDREATKIVPTLQKSQNVVAIKLPSAECQQARDIAERYEHSARSQKDDGYAAGFLAALSLSNARSDQSPIEIIASAVAQACGK
ncbi:MAG: YHYH domain-containing protein [Asticcacaulis sp.]